MKRNIISIILLFAPMLVWVYSTPLWADEGSRGGAFLPLGWDAAGEGMAGAATLLIRDDASGYWNPANLCLMREASASLGITKPVPGMPAYYSILSAGMPLMETRLHRGKESPFRRLGAALTVSHLDLELAGGSAWNESTAGISGAFSVNHFNSFGLTLRILRGWNDLENANSSGTAVDVGWTVMLRDKLWFGVTGRNIYSSISYPGRTEEIGPSWNFAIARDRILDRVSAEFDIVLRDGEINRLLGGVNAVLLEDLFSFLGGVDRRLVNGSRNILHFGFLTTYRSADISISFKLDPEEAFDKQTYLSIGYSLP